MAAVGMLGSGSWGTAPAVHLARLGHRVALWARKPEVYEDKSPRRAVVDPMTRGLRREAD